jgi:hypothetical protein
LIKILGEPYVLLLGSAETVINFRLSVPLPTQIIDDLQEASAPFFNHFQFKDETIRRFPKFLKRRLDKPSFLLP